MGPLVVYGYVGWVDGLCLGRLGGLMSCLGRLSGWMGCVCVGHVGRWVVLC